jgi:autotransporter-associated beta strand protein
MTLSGANTYSGNTTINSGTLTVANGGAINTPASTINVLIGTLTMNSGSAVTVQQLLVTNNTLTATNSFFTFSGGILTTSNTANTIAANILIPSNTAYSMSGNWTMNGGTNLISFVQTNGVWVGPQMPPPLGVSSAKNCHNENCWGSRVCRHVTILATRQVQPDMAYYHALTGGMVSSGRCGSIVLRPHVAADGA